MPGWQQRPPAPEEAPARWALGRPLAAQAASGRLGSRALLVLLVTATVPDTGMMPGTPCLWQPVT